MNGTRELVDEKWLKLESETPSDERSIRVAELPVKTGARSIVVGVDHDGYRHLLIPITSHLDVRRGLDGPVLQLRKRPLEDGTLYQHYADLGCLRPDLNDVFTTMCADVLDTAGTLPNNPLKALYRVLDRWKSLFQTSGVPLDTDQIIGLFGELLVLTRLLERDSSAHRFWKGPSGHEHDFATAHTALEVKATSGPQRRRVRIHGIDQLTMQDEGVLRLAWFRLERGSDTGEDLPTLVNRALRLCDDESTLLALLASVGYYPSDNGYYKDIRLYVAEERWYSVDDDFPKLTRAQLTDPTSIKLVSDIAYTVDLSGEPPIALNGDTVTGFLDDLIREHA